MTRTYVVAFEYVETDGSIRNEPMTIPLGKASRHIQVMLPEGKMRDELEGPWIIEGKKYEGPLSEEEAAGLRMLPGKEYSAHWRFSVKEVK